jgi:hypothetical protein
VRATTLMCTRVPLRMVYVQGTLARRLAWEPGDKIMLVQVKTRPGKEPGRPYADLWSRPGYLVRRMHQIHVGLFWEECHRYDITPYGQKNTYAFCGSVDHHRGQTTVSGYEVRRQRPGKGLPESPGWGLYPILVGCSFGSDCAFNSARGRCMTRVGDAGRGREIIHAAAR